MRVHWNVENLLGEECITAMLDYVRGGGMIDEQLTEFVRHLGDPDAGGPCEHF